jgi:hypothetical protein
MPSSAEAETMHNITTFVTQRTRMVAIIGFFPRSPYIVIFHPKWSKLCTAPRTPQLRKKNY